MSLIIAFQHTDDLFQVSLTQDQARVIAKRLPQGFSVTLCRQSKREVAKKKLQQDISSEEDHKVTKKPHIEPPIKATDEIKRCMGILQKLKKHPSAAPFLRRLDSVNYPTEIEYVDLQIVEQNLKNNAYQSAAQFWGDVKKIWHMSYTMNNRGTQLYAMTQEIEQFFQELYREIDKPYPPKHKEPGKVSHTTTPGNTHPKTGKRPPAQKPTQDPKLNKMELPMNQHEKASLVTNIRNLPQEALRGVWEIVSDGRKVHDQNGEFEFDIDTLPVKTTRMLEKFVNQKLEIIRKQKRVEDTTELNDRIVHSQPKKQVQKTTQSQSYAPRPTQIQGENDTGDSSFSSDGDESD